MIVPALLVGVLFTVGTYLILQRALTRVVIGFAVLAHGVNLLILAGGATGDAPLIGRGSGDLSDPLPQAFILTAIVISFGVTAFLLTLALRSWQLNRDDDVEDDIEDRRIVRSWADRPRTGDDDGVDA